MTELETVPGYRPVSPLAVAAAGTGAAAVLAVVSPLFWMLPLVGAAVAVAALYDVDRPGAAKAGRLAALAGLALSAGFGAQAAAAALTARWIACGRAEAAARVWIDAIRAEKLDDARSMCGPDVVRAVDDVAACVGAAGEAAPPRCRGLEGGADGWVVRATAGGCEFEIVLAAAPAGDGERWTVVRCETVRRSAN